MHNVIKKILKNIESDTVYSGCTFYLDENVVYNIKNSHFENCSFRSSVCFGNLEMCGFSSCGFSNKVMVQIIKNDVQDHVFSLSFLTHLILYSPQNCERINSKLRTINLNSNDFILGPMNKLSSLISLNLSGNNIKQMPETIKELRNLEELDVSLNKLAAFPLYKNLPLKHLNISHNYLKKFPNTLLRYFRLESLDISNNQIRSIPSQILELKNLRQLNLSNNKLTTLPFELKALPCLRNVYLCDNLFDKNYQNYLCKELPHCNIIFTSSTTPLFLL
ncbi:leucine-rich repeat domain-containing protein [Candidatus Uabimicrobium sp. HlEnr_7]|uniref:leucine-rich repeat domain-containing protein n=1 Tax=Candidatus Uabimicrobium helgolandensis TaxID=3095367 RepID=UPI0035584BB5